MSGRVSCPRTLEYFKLSGEGRGRGALPTSVREERHGTPFLDTRCTVLSAQRRGANHLLFDPRTGQLAGDKAEAQPGGPRACWQRRIST